MLAHDLLLEMIERMSVAAVMAFVLSQTAIFRRLIYNSARVQDRVALIVIFGLIGIAGTYAGIPVNGALANSRVVGVMAAGLVGGPVMGVAAGVIAGGHRYFMGGFTALSCALANICEGLLAGMVHRWYPGRPIPWWIALVAGAVGEVVQMAIILLTARPYDLAQGLVREIALPMISVNAVGIAIFMLIVKSVMEVQQKVGAQESQKALDIATKTLPYLRRGLNRESAQAAAEIIHAAGGYDAVAITDTERILAFVGAEADHHRPEKTSMTKATGQALASGALEMAQNAEEIGCTCEKCRLASAVVVPLKRGDAIIGTLKLYSVRRNAIHPSDRMFAAGLAHLFSTQLELTEIDRQAKLAANAEVKALYAQINPHFLFNTLNTITSLIRTQPDTARELLQKLGSMFRYVLRQTGKEISLDEEMDQVRAYLTIERARHGALLQIKEDIPLRLGKYLIPSLSIQPLVENAIRHGLQPKEEGGTIRIWAREEGETLEVGVSDDGVGMDVQEKMPLSKPAEGCIGLCNVHERLRGQYGAVYGLEIQSRRGRGTSVIMRLPKRAAEERDHCA